MNNNGAGISASSGITSVASSTFQDNHGPGVWLQNTPTSTTTRSRAPARRRSDHRLAERRRTLLGNTATGSSLANLQGYGSAFVSGDSGQIVTGSNIAMSGDGGGNDACHRGHARRGGAGASGVSATTATMATPPDRAAGNRAGRGDRGRHRRPSDEQHLHRHRADRHPCDQLDPGSDRSRPWRRQIICRSPAAAGHPNHRRRRRERGHAHAGELPDPGSGADGDGIKIVADGADRSIHNLNISGVNVEHVGGIGLDVIGNVQGSVFDSWMHGDAQGARFANSAGGGVRADSVGRRGFRRTVSPA